MLSSITPSIFPRSLDTELWNRPLNSSLFNRPFGSNLSLRDPFDSSIFSPDFGTTALDLFDPFNEIDRLANRSIRWLNEPSILPSRLMSPLIPQKFRISLDCSGYNENSIKTEVKGNLLKISAKEGGEAQKGKGDYNIREFSKTYDLPEYVDSKKLVSFMTNDGTLVVEFPWKENAMGSVSLLPNIDEKNKTVSLDVVVPDNIDPDKVHVTCKDRDLIVRADYRVKNDDGSTRSRVHYLRRTTLPENTDFNSLKCEAEQNKLHLTAQLGPHQRRRIPITHVDSKSSIEGQQDQSNKMQ
jgi:HSP20 family molecular chaperone IbpA